MATHLVFISYSTKDRYYADAICSWVENNHIPAWIAPRDIVPGSNYGESIINAIKNAKIMVVVFTRNADTSRYVNLEVERGISNGCIIIPVRFQDVVPTKGMELFLSSKHWLDILTPPIEAHLDKLVASIKKLVDTEKAPVTVNKNDNRAKDKNDIKVFNEQAPDDWFSKPGNGFVNRILNLFKDNS